MVIITHHFLGLVILGSEMCKLLPALSIQIKTKFIFPPKDYKLHLWLEETPTQMLNLLNFSQITDAPTRNLCISISFSHPFLFT